jgi:hypothetical protein
VRGGFGRASVANKGIRECSREPRYSASVYFYMAVHIHVNPLLVYTLRASSSCPRQSISLVFRFSKPSQTYHNIHSYLGFSWIFVMQKAQSKSNWQRISESGLIVSGVVGVGDNEHALVNGIYVKYMQRAGAVCLIHP